MTEYRLVERPNGRVELTALNRLADRRYRGAVVCSGATVREVRDELVRMLAGAHLPPLREGEINA